jgi:hypothetical protein
LNDVKCTAAFLVEETEESMEVGDELITAAFNKSKIFFKLASFVLSRLTIAHSTAAVERTFSIVTCVKSKLRNRMAAKTLEALLSKEFNRENTKWHFNPEVYNE